MMKPEHALRTHNLCHEQVAENAALQTLKTGKLLSCLKEVLQTVDEENQSQGQGKGSEAAAAERPAKRARTNPNTGVEKAQAKTKQTPVHSQGAKPEEVTGMSTSSAGNN